MAHIGDEGELIYVEPLELPEPLRTPEPVEQPVAVPEKEPVLVP